MSDTPAFLVVTSTPNPDKMDLMEKYASQIMPILMKGGGEPVSRYGVVEQLRGEGAPKSIAVVKFPSAQAIKDVLATDAYKALEELRTQAFKSVDIMSCAEV